MKKNIKPRMKHVLQYIDLHEGWQEHLRTYICNRLVAGMPYRNILPHRKAAESYTIVLQISRL